MLATHHYEHDFEVGVQQGSGYFRLLGCGTSVDLPQDYHLLVDLTRKSGAVAVGLPHACWWR